MSYLVHLDYRDDEEPQSETYVSQAEPAPEPPVMTCSVCGKQLTAETAVDPHDGAYWCVDCVPF